ncbi:glycosyltransferase family 2 protein [Paracoccus sp. S1E-3]|uniref:glycosyltransferase family 2 protein n=1 Tax=Paracoccus sp. S1E-3 TaxID=2756130 RepID=UPI0015EF657A|nr:glycosyltransferase family 2 protein [Paracoccus sp. S1E-3]MBA4492042.1 hypothetical protein [Paracoccus sp. S1E-3]
MKVQVLTNVRTDEFFLALWIHYYGGIFGRENLHIMLDGDDWTPTVDLTDVNVHVVANVPRERVRRDRRTARWQSGLANNLLRDGTDVVLRTDIDEFVAVDPATGMQLPEYLATLGPETRRAAIGLDVIQAPSEGPLAPDIPILQQRRNAILTREFSKLVVARAPLRWMSGFHRGKEVPVDLSTDLLLFHLALFDRETAARRIAGRKKAAEDSSEGDHIAGRFTRFDEISESQPLDFDARISDAREHLMKSLPSPTGPHVGRIPDGNVARGYHIGIPDRMTGLLPSLDAFLPG